MRASAPVVIVRGQQLAGSVDTAAPDELVGLSEIVLPWGRAAYTERLQPQVATIRLIERSPLSQFPRWGSYVGARVEIRQPYFTPGDRPAFVGQVTDESARQIHLTGGTATEVTLTCADVPGILSQITMRGDYEGILISRRYPGAWKQYGYKQDPPNRRVFYLGDGGAVSTWVRQIATSTVGDQLIDGVQADSMPTAWELIDQSFELMQPLTSPSITGDTISATAPRGAPHITIQSNVSGQIVIDSGTAARVDPKTLRMSDPDAMPDISVENKHGAVALQMSKRIVNMVISGGQQSDEIEDASEALIVLVPNAKGSNRQHKVAAVGGASVSKLDGSEQPGVWPTESTPQATASETALRAFAEQLAEQLGSLNTQGHLPSLTYVEPDQGTAQSVLLRPQVSPPLWIGGNKWAAMRQMPRIVQVLGGQLRWTGKRWEHDINFVGMPDAYGKDLSLDEMFGSSTKTVSDFAPSIRTADLFDVTRSTL